MSKSDIANTPRKVFISYSHKDEGWKNKLLPHLKALEQAGVNMVVWEDRQIDAGAQWAAEIEQAMADAGAAVLLISADYLASGFCIKEEVPYLLKRQEQEGMLLIPILIRKCPWKAHRWLADRQMLPRDGKCVAIDFPADLADAVFADVAERVFDHFTSLAAQSKAKAALPIVTHEVVVAGARMAATVVESARISRWPALPADRIDLTRLPETGAALFGRDEELKLLDQAWSSGEKPGEAQTRVLAFVAYGGVGKSTLVNHWLQEMQRDHFRGATCVFGWSFYSQGAREEGMASADTFTDAALRFFGDADPASGSAWDKGERLARLAGAERALLVLDGMEPLQSGHAFDRGKLRDPALECLLRGLARGSGGLCLVTTREPVPDLAGRPGFASRDLEQISPEAGRALLRTARVVGTDAELEALAGRFGPHALAVSLLGVYLHEKDPHRGIGSAKVLEQMPGKEPIDRVLAGFEQWLADTAELEVLRMLGLFDRPADAGCLGALRAKPAIPDLSARIVELSDADWDRVLGRLERLRLIHIRHKDSAGPVVDAHPLLREHFARRLREENPDAWRAAHRRLYEHLCATTPDKPQPTLEDLQPLYEAVTHGCLGGMQQRALTDVFRERIWRESPEGILKFVSTKTLGATGAELAVLQHFFSKVWAEPSEELDVPSQALVLHAAGFRLRTRDGWSDATAALRVAQAKYEQVRDWRNAADCAGNLNEVCIARGDLAEAVGHARASVDLVDRGDPGDDQWHRRAGYARVLHLIGDWSNAEMVFSEAESILQSRAEDTKWLYSLAGFYYCDFLLDRVRDLSTSDDRGRLEEVKARAKRALGRAGDYRRDIALCNLVLGRAHLLTPAPHRANVRSTASECLDNAVNGSRNAGRRDHLCAASLARAEMREKTGNLPGAKEDIDEAWQIAERGPMRLFLADIHLHRARLFHAVTPYPWDKDEQGQPRGPKDDLAAARKLIEQCGYHRRDEELADAEEAAQGW